MWPRFGSWRSELRLIDNNFFGEWRRVPLLAHVCTSTSSTSNYISTICPRFIRNLRSTNRTTMASKRTLVSIPTIARLASPAPARTSATLSLLRSRRHLPVSVASTTVRLAHSIPRPRNGSPFSQSQQPTTPTPTRSGSTPTTTATSTPTSTPSSQPDPAEPQSQPQQQAAPNIRQQPHYELTFTCRPCDTRSRHRVSKQGYHHGSVLIACPSCKNRHVISDHLRIFGDKAMTVEDLLRDKGELVKKGTLGEEGDLEFWDDGTSSVREPWAEVEAAKGEGEDLPPGSTFKSVRSGDRKVEE
ncbi:DNL zinc finger-domain-containing protein [Chaetomium fimeti]|uniref:DNL zinc finger-domain-containing protein n=1 Tax=Chaetomium fimeti TaxID=1854472 RepID=A0AAE0LX36_9PEZI|nr:DNL zinc finger-domain-containing protein [Chaetomium fimeti]